MSAPPSDATIEDYLDQLARGLHIRAGDVAGRDLLDEACDHLHSHTEHLIDDGMPRHAATAAAVADFGDLREVLPRLRAELLRPHLRRLSAVLLTLGLVLGAGWTVLFELAPPVPWTSGGRPRLSRAFDRGAEAFAGAALMLSTVSLTLVVLPGNLRAMARWRAAGQRWSTCAAMASLMFGTAAGLQTFGYLVIRTAAGAESLHWPAVTVAVLATLAGASLVAHPLLAITTRYLGDSARVRTRRSPA